MITRILIPVVITLRAAPKDEARSSLFLILY